MEQQNTSINKDPNKLNEEAIPSPDEKGASDIDIKQRDATPETPEEHSKKPLAPSGDLIANTGADIGSKGSVEETDAASG